MSAVEKIDQFLAGISRAEKAMVLQRIVQEMGEAFPGVESREGVCGGEPCIVRTRIPVWVLWRMRQQGISEADILRSYPTLAAEDLANAWHYAAAHRADIEQQIQDNENA